MRERKPCNRCGGPKPPGARRRYCDSCDPLSDVEKAKRYRKRHPDRIRKSARKWQRENPKKLYEIHRRSVLRNPERRMLELAKARAKKSGLPFSITLADIVIPKTCPVLGIELRVARQGFSDNSPTLDRANNDKGYVPGNVLVVSWRANRIKGDATVKELRALADFYGKWRG